MALMAAGRKLNAGRSRQSELHWCRLRFRFVEEAFLVGWLLL